MRKSGKIHWQHLHEELSQLTGHLAQVQFPHFGREKHWQPALNAYRCADHFILCLDLAGVDRKGIRVEVEPGKLLIYGHRPPPEPDCRVSRTVQVFAMEIDYGDFRRELALPVEVDPDGVTARYRNGLLWIRLPTRPHG